MKNKMKKKPELNKKTVSSLKKQQLSQIIGGDDIVESYSYDAEGTYGPPISYLNDLLYISGYIDSQVRITSQNQNPSITGGYSYP